MYCPQCGLRQPNTHRFCMSCGHRFPTEPPRIRRPKATRLYRSLPIVPADDPGAILRVSRYLEQFTIYTEDGSVQVPSQHVRFSIWQEDQCLCALSIPDDEAQSLAEFLQAEVTNGLTGSEPAPVPS